MHFEARVKPKNVLSKTSRYYDLVTTLLKLYSEKPDNCLLVMWDENTEPHPVNAIRGHVVTRTRMLKGGALQVGSTNEGHGRAYVWLKPGKTYFGARMPESLQKEIAEESAKTRGTCE